MTSFVDWMTAQDITMTVSNPEFGAVGTTPWARTDLEQLIAYKTDGVTLITQTWNAFRQSYIATSKMFGRATAASGSVEELPHPWPVNSVFLGVVDTNPATLVSIGTWVSLATGLLAVGSLSFTTYAWKRTA